MTPRWNAVRCLAVLAALCLFFPVDAHAASDVVTVGTVTATGSSVSVPVYIRDVAATALGMDQPSGSRIQSFSIKVSFDPAAVQSVTFNRAGITANLDPTSEFKPSSSGSISLLATFVESTNLIPFTLNGSAPGNLVANLSFTLSPSAAPGSSIALTLDSSLTQLTDSGGTAATKETSGNGRLSLVDGRINIPALSVSLSPQSKNVAPGGMATLTATLNLAPPSNTTVALVSSNPAVATVPASVVISAGVKSNTFKVTGVALGTAKITATLNSSTSTTNVVVEQDQPTCTKPAAPQINAPANADIGVPYSVSWNAVTSATEYEIEESTNPEFSGPATQTLTGTSVSFTHATGGVRYYYRVRGRNRGTGCDVLSNYSSTVSVLINEAPVPDSRILTVVGSLQGNAGSFFRTSVQLHNPHSSDISGKIVFHPAGTAGTANDPSQPFVITPGTTLAFDDLLPAMGIAGGIGSVDLVADIGSALPVALVRVFNDAGAAGTSGLTEDALAPDDALRDGQSGVLIAPLDVQKFRLNIGVRSLDQGASISITVRDKDGTTVRTVARSYEPTYFTQVSSAVLLDGYALAGGETISFAVTSGSAFIYGATTDNTTNDPSVQFARRIE